jgi:PHD/YefM family antitoxin component YafN of YafNO toxin-antitoxin module
MKMNVQERFIVDTKGRKTGIILSLSRYQKLMEDLHDLAVVAERRAETSVSLSEMKRRLKKDGIL